ncbi:MAG: U32 family peptidase C-terminal domain-containing protein [Pseudomonadota bacterium]
MGDQLEVLHPGGNTLVTVEQIRALDGAPMEVAPGSGHRVRIALDQRYDKALLARML